MNGKWSYDNFLLHHKDNPEIYNSFKGYALKAASYRDKYSARGIFHLMRWDTMVQEKGSEYKIDDGWSPHYARMFMEEYPQHGKLFETRVRENSYHKQ